jgi:hypothetical protein
MGLLDKIKGALRGNKGKASSAIDKAADVAASKAGKHADKIEAGADKAKDAINKL